MKVLVTGGAGNLGRCLAQEFTTHGHQVTLFDRVAPGQAPVPWETDLPFIAGELTSSTDFANAVAAVKPEAIAHVGAIPYATDHPDNRDRSDHPLPPDETWRVNTLGTYYVLDAAVRNGVKTLAFASTFFVLGLGFRISTARWLPAYLPIDEEHPLTPEDTYSLSKMINEEMLEAYTRAYGIRTLAFRLLGVYYAHRDDSATRFRPEAAAPVEGKPNFGGWLYVDGRDAAQAFRLGIEKADRLNPHERFYLASDRTIAESSRDALNRLFPELADLARGLGSDDLLISIAKAQKLLGYEPRHSWRATS